MNAYWLDIDTKHSSYVELKHRKMIALGWSGLGDLKSLIQVDNFDLFTKTVQYLGDKSYGHKLWWSDWHGQLENVPSFMYLLLFNVKAGDIVIGVEKNIAVGICQVTSDGMYSYKYDSSGAYDYAQTISFPVKWHDLADGAYHFDCKKDNFIGIEDATNDLDNILKAWNVINCKSNNGRTL